MKTRLAPALTLLVLTPLVAEYLLGSLSFSKEQIGALPVMCLLYGAGAVLIREVARATRRGWPAIVLLGVAYALLEEGLMTQSLFNPHYLHLTLLDYGYIPALGIGANWTLYVLSLHVIWSVCVPIGLVEALYPRRSDVPWLTTISRSVFALLFTLGAVAVTAFTWKTEHFIASTPQIIVALLSAAVAVVLAMRRPKPTGAAIERHGAPSTPPLWTLVATALLLGSLFCLAQSLRSRGAPWPVAVFGTAAIVLFGVMAIRNWAKRPGWGMAQRTALATGGVLVYCWFGYTVEVSLHGRGGLVPHTVLVLAIIALLAVARRRVGAPAPASGT